MLRSLESFFSFFNHCRSSFRFYNNQQVLPKVIWEERITTPTLENALSHCVLAVACRMHNEVLPKHCGLLRDVTERCRSIMGCYGALWNIRYETSRNVTEALQIIMENIDFKLCLSLKYRYACCTLHCAV